MGGGITANELHGSRVLHDDGIYAATRDLLDHTFEILELSVKDKHVDGDVAFDTYKSPGIIGSTFHDR